MLQLAAATLARGFAAATVFFFIARAALLPSWAQHLGDAFLTIVYGFSVNVLLVLLFIGMAWLHLRLVANGKSRARAVAACAMLHGG